MALNRETLIAFSKGDRAAFDKVYAAYSPGMFGVSLRYTRCEDDAKDVLQESFIRIYENSGTYNTDLPFGPWIKTIVIRTALNYIRSNYRFVLTDNDSRFDHEVTEDTQNDQLEDYKKHLLQVLQKLPDGYRTVFNLYTIDNLTHKEIAEHLGISEGTSKSQYFKAKKMIQEMLETVKTER